MNLAIFPFDRESLVFTRSFRMNPTYNVKSLVAPRSFGWDGCEFETHNGKLIVKSDFMEEIEACDAVLIVNTWNDINYINEILPKVKVALDRGKDVIIIRELSQKEYELTKEIKGKISFLLKNEYTSWSGEPLQELVTPIVSIGGMTPYNEKFEMSLAVKERFEDMGYKVLLVSPKTEALLFRGEPFFKNFFNMTSNETEKTFLLNKYLHELEIKIKPDIIVLEIPGVMMAYNSKFLRDFGVLAVEIFEAVKPDYFIMSFPFTTANQKEYEQIGNVVEQKYGFKTDYYHLSQFMVDHLSSENERKLLMVTLPISVVNDQIDCCNFSRLFNFRNKKLLENCVNDIIEKLTGDYINII